MLGSTLRWSGALLLVAGTIAGVAARADAPPMQTDVCSLTPPNGRLDLRTNRIGLVDLYLSNAPGAAVAYFECRGDRGQRLGEASSANGGTTKFSTPWLCDRLKRHFAATATLLDGTVLRGLGGVQTPSCADRFDLTVPRRIGPGQAVRVRVIDRWGLGGIRTTLCFTAPAGRRDCRRLRFAPAVSVRTSRSRPATRGDWRVELHVQSYRVRGTFAVGVQSVALKVPPTVLATGDSTMHGLDSSLADDLGAQALVVSDVRFGSGISTAPWLAIARAQVDRLRPSATVISLGAAEGFPMRVANGGTVTCCGGAWVSEYSRRVRELMVIYRRRGRGRVVYLTISAPRSPRLAVIADAVNQAIVRAGTDLAGVRVLRADLVFSPHGYQETIRYRGWDVAVREPDGVHLNVSGTAIEALDTAKVLHAARL